MMPTITITEQPRPWCRSTLADPDKTRCGASVHDQQRLIYRNSRSSRHTAVWGIRYSSYGDHHPLCEVCFAPDPWEVDPYRWQFAPNEAVPAYLAGNPLPGWDAP